MTRTQNAVRNMSWGFTQKIITLLMPFLTRTVLIKALGFEYLGLNSLFTSILGLLSLAELGVSNAIISTMYKPIAENDTDTICALMAFYKKAYYVIGIVITIVGISIMPFLDRFISGDVPKDINIYYLYVIYLVNTAASYFLFAYKNCLFIAHQRNDVNSKVQTFCMFIQYIIQIILVLRFKNYYCYAVVIPIISITVNLFTAHLAVRTYPQYTTRGLLNKEIKYDVKQKVMGLMLAKISATIRSSIDSLFISAFLGLRLVAMYSNYFYITTAVVGIIQVLETALVAGIGNSLAVEPIEKNHHDFIKFTFLLQWIVGWCSICILCLIQPFMSVWVGKGYMFSDAMAMLCALYLFVNSICLIRSIYTQALGMWWSLKYLSIADIFVNCFLNYILGKYLGAYGIIGATIIDIAFVSLPWTTYFLFRDYFGKNKYWEYIFFYLKYFAIAVSVGMITYFACTIVTLDKPFLQLIFNGVLCMFIPNLFYLLIFGHTRLFKESVRMVSDKIETKMKLRS